MRYKYAAKIQAALLRLGKGERYVLLEMPAMSYRQTDSLRNQVKQFSCGQGFQLHTRTIHLNDMTLLFVAVK